MAAIVTVKLTREPTLVRPAEETKKGIYFLSNLDCGATTVVRTIYCFKNKCSSSSTERGEHDYDDDVWEVMKTSLSKVLVHYYPLAGRLTTAAADGRRCVDCTGEGVVFVEAEADCELDKIADATMPDVANRRKLVYDDVRGAMGPMDYPPLIAQVTKFKCGGFVLGLALNHLLADGISAVEFVNSWGETARGIPLSVPPFLDRTLLKARTPPTIKHHPSEYDALPNKLVVSAKEEVVYRYILFDEDMINKIKQEYSMAAHPDDPKARSTNKKCSSYEAITAFVWKARTEALKMAADEDQLTRVLVVMDGRAKFEPPLPKGYFGNAIKYTPATCRASDLVDKPLSYAVGLVREAIRRVTDEHLRSTIDYYETTRANRPLGSTFISSSWTRLPFGSTDFGWGEPISTGPVELPIDEAVWFLPRQEKGKTCIYAFMGLPISAMKNFQDSVLQFKEQSIINS